MHSWWGCEMVQLLWKTVSQVLKNQRTTACPSLPTSGHRIQGRDWRDARTPIFIAAFLLMAAKGGSSLSAHRQLVHLHRIPSALKGSEFWRLLGHPPSETGQPRKDARRFHSYQGPSVARGTAETVGWGLPEEGQ